MESTEFDYPPVVTLGPIGDVANILPRHVGSRVMVTDSGDQIWRPASDVFETEKSIIIHTVLPGGPKSEIKLDMDQSQNQLIIHGHHHDMQPFGTATSRIRERRIGRFRKVVYLPMGCEQDRIQAKYEDGVLEVVVPKGKGMKRKNIAIE